MKIRAFETMLETMDPDNRQVSHLLVGGPPGRCATRVLHLHSVEGESVACGASEPRAPASQQVSI
jgi:hypothetical protein